MVFCTLGGEESGSVLDLSEDGLRFDSPTPIEEKDLLQLRLSVDPNDAIEATGKLAWIDAAKCTGGLRFLDLSAPAREQIRAWLSETSTACSETNGRASPRKGNKQADDGAATEKLVILEQTHVPSTQLVPIERYREQTRLQFRRGVLVGFGICVVVMIPIFFQYPSGTQPGSPARTTASANRVTQSSGEQNRAFVAQPVPPGTSNSEPTAAKPLARGPAATQPVSAAVLTGSLQKQSPQIAGTSSTGVMTRTSSRLARPQPAKAEQQLGASPAVAAGPAASPVHSSVGQIQNPRKVSATAQQLWSALQAGDMNAAVALADLYARGDGVPVNCEQARILLLAALEKNNEEASKKLKRLNKGGCPAKTE